MAFEHCLQSSLAHGRSKLKELRAVCYGSFALPRQSVSCMAELCSSSQQNQSGLTAPTCISQSFSGALPGRSMSPIHSTCTMWKVSHPKMPLTHAKGEPTLLPSSAMALPLSVLVFGADLPTALDVTAGSGAAVPAAACDESAVSAFLVEDFCCCFLLASCFFLRVSS